MNLLMVSHEYPRYDRHAGSLRFFSIIKILAESQHVFFYNSGLLDQCKTFGEADTLKYQTKLAETGVTILTGELPDLLKLHAFDAVFFEFYGSCRKFVDIVRHLQPDAKVIVDTVDVHYRRMLSKPESLKDNKYIKDTNRTKRREIEAYSKADIVITVTNEDSEELYKEIPSAEIVIIPTIHSCPPLIEKNPKLHSLIFVAGFMHEPNVDAAMYLVKDIFPLILQVVPDVTLKLVGDSPPECVRQLSSDSIEVTGFVQSTAPYLEQSAVSVAPLRYGAGIKGKIGEAMAHGVPVVTTPIGAEGYGINMQNLLIAQDNEQFAEYVVRLFNDNDLYEQIRKNGWQLVYDEYSEHAVREKLISLIERTRLCPVKRISALSRMKIYLKSKLG